MRSATLFALLCSVGSCWCLPVDTKAGALRPASGVFETDNRVVIDGRIFEAIPTHRVREPALPSRQLLQHEPEPCEKEAAEEFSLHNLVATLCCIVLAALAAGLTMGLVALDEEDVDLVLQQDPAEIDDRQEREQLENDQESARKLHFFVTHNHWTLVTLLLLNAVANEALPIYLDKLVPSPVIAIMISVTAVLIFGEILPTAIFTGPKQLKIAATLSPMVWFALIVTSFISWPISKGLDLLLGEHQKRYTKSKMRALIRIQQRDSVKTSGEQQEFVDDELTMMHGALSLKTTEVDCCAVKLEQVHMLSLNTVLNLEYLALVHTWGNSRLPVYNVHPHNIRGFVSIKDMILASPEDNRPVSTLPQRELIAVGRHTNMQDLLNTFQEQKTQMALLCDKPEVVTKAWEDGTMIPADVHMIGIVTIYDVFKCLINEEWLDEQDAHHAVIEAAHTALALRYSFRVLQAYARVPELRRSRRGATSPVLDFKDDPNPAVRMMPLSGSQENDQGDDESTELLH